MREKMSDLSVRRQESSVPPRARRGIGNVISIFVDLLIVGKFLLFPPSSLNRNKSKIAKNGLILYRYRTSAIYRQIYGINLYDI